ncbi:MAG TPA: winged helix-turn-helix domain-containing protein [Blastocatellia bacterium]|jgi:Tol biopolymer transport system component/DNA-binding winged helix-turn-helix (wHTH) protein|nr:winged helix-turn-helix domain-containing protein [Blastocatellia bacterium]
MRHPEPQNNQYYEFGPFRLAAAEHRLYRDGEIIMLPPKEFDLLLLLVQNPGQVMNRESLIKALWPDTVVEEANLNVHISALRKALAEKSGEQHYIETLPRLGYRFIAPVTEVNGAAMISSISQVLAENGAVGLSQNGVTTVNNRVAADWHSRRLWAAIPLWLLAVGLLGVPAFLYFKPLRSTGDGAASVSPINVVPLTTYHGRESQPAFSPDGNQIAFVWSGERDDNQDIYVRLVDGGNWVRLTDDPGDDVNPVWSPDGRTIAFYRSSSDGDGIFLVPALGGAERKLTGVWANRFSFGIHTWIHWSPDGRWLAVSDKTSAEEPFSLFLVSPETGEKRRVTSPPASIVGDCSPAFSPDGAQLAFVRVISAVVGEVYLVSVNGGEPKRLTFDGAGVGNLAWTPNGREIVFASRLGGKSRLYRIPVEGGAPEWLAATGSDAQYPTFSSEGSRLAWRQNTSDIDIFRLPRSSGSENGRSLTDLIVSTAVETSPRYSPDGKRIAFVSNRSGSDEIWVCGSDGENPTRLTSFRGPLAGSPGWSPDGKQIVFDCRPEGNADIYVVSVEGGQPRRLTTDPAEDIVPSWSRDGRWIYFTSNRPAEGKFAEGRSGRLQIWKMPADGGAATQMTQQGGFEPMESPDGQWIYFTQDRGSSSIRRMPAAGGAEAPLFDFHQKSYSRIWTVTNEGIYFAVANSNTQSTIKFLSFATGIEKTVAEIDRVLPSSVPGLTISPDGKWLLFPLFSQRGSDLMMIENFR